MTRKKILTLLVPVLLAAAALYAFVRSRASVLVLTGVVTTNDVVVSPQIGGPARASCSSTEGDTVKKGQLLAVISPDELRAETAYYAQSAEGLSSQVAGVGGRPALPGAAERPSRSGRPSRTSRRPRPRRRRPRPTASRRA